MKTIRVAVVGDGLAGLTTADLLKRYCNVLGDAVAIDVCVFRSQAPVKKDFLFIADTEYCALSLMDEFNVELVPDNNRAISRPFSTLMTTMIAEILALKSKGIIEQPEDWSCKENDTLDALDAISIVEYFVKKGEDAEALHALLRSSLLGFYADDLDSLSALDALRFVAQYLHCKFTYSIKQGNHYLLQTLMDSLNADKQRVFINKCVSDVELLRSQWRLRFDDGSESSLFDYIVMARPQQFSYFQPGQRRLITEQAEPSKGLFFAGESTSPDAPASMKGAVQSAYRVVDQHLLPAICVTLPNNDDCLMPEVPMAVFTCGNDATLDDSESGE